MTDERVMKLARRIVAEHNYPKELYPESWGIKKHVYEGLAHETDVQVALAAIKLTTKLAADLAWKQADDLNHGPRAEYKDHRQFDAGRAHEANIMCNRLRNNEHLPNDGGENV